MELDDDVLKQIDLAEKVALQDKGKGKGKDKGKGKAKADTYTSMQSKPSSSSGSRTTGSGSGKTSTAASGSITTRSSKSKDTPAREVIAIDEEDDFDSMYCSLDEADFSVLGRTVHGIVVNDDLVQ
jgi:hypothetical protein